MIHKLKTWPEPFQNVWDLDKPYEVRRADRDFKLGDIVHLEEWLPVPGAYTGRVVVATISYLTPPGAWGLPDNVCVFALAAVKRIDLTPQWLGTRGFE